MHETAAAPAWVMIAYLVAGGCFILALRGLSSPESSRTGNRLGMLGMAIAVGTTLVSHEIAGDSAGCPACKRPSQRGGRVGAANRVPMSGDRPRLGAQHERRAHLGRRSASDQHRSDATARGKPTGRDQR